MKGKNKSFIILFSLLLVVAFGVTCFARTKQDTIPFARAEEIEGYTDLLEGNVIFSAENVYIANGDENRESKVSYNEYAFSSIKNNEDKNIYFGNYDLREGNSYKKVIKSGQYVMLDNKEAPKSVVIDGSESGITVSQAVMITVGGYYFDASGDVRTTGDSNPGSANLEILSITAKRNGKDISVPGSRSENACFDFVWFLDATAENEGHYELAISYMVKNGNLLKYDFDFYLLLKSSYEDEVSVNGNNYAVSPTMYGAGEKNNSTTQNRQYKYFLGTTASEYPTLTFDYTRYNLEYTFNSGDAQHSVKFEYDETNRLLTLSTSVYNSVKQVNYPIDVQNTIVTIMFASAGKYKFDFKYVYYNEGQRLEIPTTDLDFPDVSLDIYGYELVYSKAGFKSAKMEYLEIAKNGTMFILADGFQTSSTSPAGSELGVNYVLVNSSSDKTGIITRCEASNVINSKYAYINVKNAGDTWVDAGDGEKWDDSVFKDVTYQTTNQGGVWLSLNDDYDLANSYYFFNPDGRITIDYANATGEDADGNTTYTNVKPITKVTTFTEMGYYLIQARYSYKNESGEVEYKTQYFAFRITLLSPQLDLWKITNEDDENFSKVDKIGCEEFYGREFTNKDVFGDWKEPDVFEAKITAKLYYSTGKYPTESAYRKYIEGTEINNSISWVEYAKYTTITDSGSYMITLELENTSTRTYTFFTIDKEKISGLKVYEVATNWLDNKATYSIMRDANQNFVDYTSRGVIDVDFTLSWNEKASGAKITGGYTFTPFVKTTDVEESQTVVSGKNTYMYVPNGYKVGSTSKWNKFSKPNLNSALNLDEFLAMQGIYVFTIEDEAGNRLQYIMIMDKTETIIKAVYGDGKEYISGNMVTEDVSLTWGTHKAIDLSNLDANHEIKSIIENGYADLKDYYDASGNNKLNISSLFKTVGSKLWFVVENTKANIKIWPYDKNQDNYYVLTSKGQEQMVSPSGYVNTGWDELGTELFEKKDLGTDKCNLTIKKDENSVRYYTVGVISSNQTSNEEQAVVSVVITPDEARGEVYSTSQESGEYTNWVRSAGKTTTYNENNELEITDYAEGQASNDGLFVFEWKDPVTSETGAGLMVTEVRYDYYELMDQTALNNIKNVNDKGFYYPYKWASTEYILNTTAGKEVYNYTSTVRGSEAIYRSNPINLGPETYYDNGSVVSRNVTRTGLYIITRTIKDEANTTDKGKEFSYVFFVDRNSIVGYSTSSVSEKIVGQFIHNTLPTSEGELHFNNFAIQGLTQQVLRYNEDTIQYKVYLETNKLPTKLLVPSGKYVSGDVNQNDANSIIATSYNNLKLSLSVYFIDSYGILEGTSKGLSILLMDDVTSGKNGYIDLKFSSLKNQGIIANYKKARIHGEDGSLSLPGTYIFVLHDNVGKVDKTTQALQDCNIFTFAIKLTRQAPSTDVYAYTQIGNDVGDKLYSDEQVLYTNEEFVDFEIPVEDVNSYKAQLDPYSFEIYRKEGNNSKLWLRLYRSGSTFVVDTSGIIQTLDRIQAVDKDGNPTNDTEKIVKYIIKLDTGKIVDNGEYEPSQISELSYSIKIQYVLVNSGEKYYTYLENGTQKNFCATTYNVYIDRTPNTTNLDSILSGQTKYFTEYEQYLAKANGLETSKINANYKYRSETTVKDYYVLSNRMFYTFVEGKDYTMASQSMYAISIESEQAMDITGLSKIYYRKLNFADSVDANTRMGLMPICDTYFGNSSGFYTFAESLSQYKLYSLQNAEESYPNGDMGKRYYRSILGGSQEDYENNSGTYYEIIEKDLAGNYTQYIVYFKPNNPNKVGLTITGTGVGNQETITERVFGEEDKQATFVGISSVSLDNIASNIDTVRKNSYYGNISIYNSSNTLLKTIYINSTSTQQDLNSQIYEVLKEERNYIIQYTNVNYVRYDIYIDNYQNTGYTLNTALLNLKDGDLGQKYIELTPVNTKIKDDLYCYITQVIVEYGNNPTRKIQYNAEFRNGQTVLSLGSGTDSLGNVVLLAPDRLNLGDNIDYTITLYDVFGKVYIVNVSTSDDYYSYKIVQVPTNSYSSNNIIYTSSQVQISYNTNFYNVSIVVYENGQLLNENIAKLRYLDEYEREGYNLISLKPDEDTAPEYSGTLRRFIVKLLTKADSLAQTYEIWIDTRTTEFNIENVNKESKLSNVKSYLNNEISGTDYKNKDLIQDDLYGELINETVTISWTRQTSEHFVYEYKLLEFKTADTCSVTSLKDGKITLSPKQETTGKYVFKVEIYSKDKAVWIASRIFTINISTTITGLYEVKHNGKAYDYSTITNFKEMESVLDALTPTQKDKMASDLGLNNEIEMNDAFESFGLYTAIPMYISILDLKLNSNKDNGVNQGGYTMPAGNSQITLYHVYKSNYRTFVIIMKVAQNDSLLSSFSFSTRDDADAISLLSGITSKTIYDKDASYYRLRLNSYNKNTGANILEQHNKLVVELYYNGELSKQVIGGDDSLTEIEFRNAGNYTLKISDFAGNVQLFGSASKLDNFTIVLMKELLYTVNDEAPIKYAYYDKPVTIKINKSNTATGGNNYDGNTITLKAYLNNSNEEYRGYTKPANSYVYTFEKYGTYLIEMSANLVTGELITSKLVFTILNPNEARTALDFTSIYSYNIVSVYDISKTVEKDVTDKFISLLADKPNQEGEDVYNKLITYDRVAQAFGSVQGKMKFRVVYEANDDDLLPSRPVEFSFTLNNETPTISCSIEAGKKTTKPVTIKFNASILYSQLGECYIVVNGNMENALKIDETSANEITQLQIEDVGKYYVQIIGDSGNISASFNFTIKEPLNTMSIVLIVVISAIVIGIVVTFIWLRTKMKVR